MTAQELKRWRAFCEWLDARLYKSAHTSEVPTKFRRLVYIGGNPTTGERARALRQEAGLIFYYTGWGWRLRRNWRQRLGELEGSV